MSITTKKGDDGSTFLYHGGRVAKDNIRIEICGELDELCSILGLCKALNCDQLQEILEPIQTHLFIIGAEIATNPAFLEKLPRKTNNHDVNKLDKHISTLENEHNFEANNFYIPGNGITSSALDIARALCRRVERRIVTLKHLEGLNSNIIIYLNRLSDFLYLLARKFEPKHTPLNIKKDYETPD